MGAFLRSNWPWIVVPVLLVAALLAALLLLAGGDDASPFVYPIFGG